MKTVIDGYEFKLILEGIQVPFIGASIEFQGIVSVASIEIFPAKEFQQLTSGLLVHIFFKQLGVDEEFKLLFAGSTSGKIISQNGPDRSYKLLAYGRAHKFNSILLSAFLGYDGSASPSKSAIHEGADGHALQAASPGTLNIQSGTTGNLSESDGIDKFGTYTDNFNPQNPDSGETAPITYEDKDESAPITPVSQKLTEGEAKNAIKRVLDSIIRDACRSSSIVHNTDYDQRMHLDTYINEMPAAFMQLIHNNNALDKFKKAISDFLQARLGGTASLMSLINGILSMTMAEAYEVPGYYDNALLVMPDYMASDIPVCNMIFPSEKTSVNFTDADGNKLTRLLTFSQAAAAPGHTPHSADKNIAKPNYCMFPDVIQVARGLSDKNKTELHKLGLVTLEGEEHIGARMTVTSMPSDYGIGNRFPKIMQDLTEHMFYKLKDAHRSLSITTKFMPSLIPGQKAILFDKHIPLIFKVAGLVFNITPGGLSTHVLASNIEYLDMAIFRRPDWYNNTYDPDKIHSIYKAYFGCTSMSEGADMLGEILKAYEYTKSRFDLSEIKSFLANKLNARHFDTESYVFNKLKANTQQQSDKGVLIYLAEAFDNYTIPGYKLDMSSTTLHSIRQKPVLDYVKTIYGVIGDIHE